MEEEILNSTEQKILNEKGISTVEIVLIIVVLIALVLIFKNQITALVGTIFTSINTNAAKIY